jgi:hypothetical protein
MTINYKWASDKISRQKTDRVIGTRNAPEYTEERKPVMMITLPKIYTVNRS